MRDALTHSDIGSCHLDDKSGKVFYMHGGLGTNTKAFVIEDIFSHIDNLMAGINQFMGKVFHCLNGTLEDREVWQMCGIFGAEYILDGYVQVKQRISTVEDVILLNGSKRMKTLIVLL
jgi:hypothetical protein